MAQTPKITVIQQAEKESKIMRVAAYCRVSSDSVDQLHSYASQIQYYTDLISGHPGWILADIYADGSDKIGLNQQSPYSKGGALI